MGEFSITHIILIAVVFLLFFGPSRLPQLGQSLGKAIRGFKQGISEIDAEVREVPKDTVKNETTRPDALGSTKTEAELAEIRKAEKKETT